MSDQFEQLRLGDPDSHAIIWRYLTFPKFISLLVTRALWFSKLSILADALEGMTPELTRAQMKTQHRDMEEWFPDQKRKQQVRRFVEVNEEDGRELIVANCWFMGEHESQQMWDDYVRNDEGVAIRSTPECLANSLCLSHECWWMGKMNYVDLANYDRMNVYEGHQAHRWRRGADSNPRDPSGFEGRNSTRVWRTIRPEQKHPCWKEFVRLRFGSARAMSRKACNSSPDNLLLRRRASGEPVRSPRPLSARERMESAAPQRMR